MRNGGIYWRGALCVLGGGGGGKVGYNVLKNPGVLVYIPPPPTW